MTTTTATTAAAMTLYPALDRGAQRGGEQSSPVKRTGDDDRYSLGPPAADDVLGKPLVGPLAPRRHREHRKKVGKLAQVWCESGKSKISRVFCSAHSYKRYDIEIVSRMRFSHITPAAHDRVRKTRSCEAKATPFYYSNHMPQIHSYNLNNHEGKAPKSSPKPQLVSSTPSFRQSPPSPVAAIVAFSILAS